MSTGEIDETELPLFYGLIQLVPTYEPTKAPTESNIVKWLVTAFYWITPPVLFFFHWQGERPEKTYNILHRLYIAIIISLIPGILLLLYKYKNLDLSRQTIMSCIWVLMFAVITMVYAS